LIIRIDIKSILAIENIMEPSLSLSAIQQRRIEAKHELARLQRETQAIQSVLAELDMAERLVRRFGGDEGNGGPQISSTEQSIPAPAEYQTRRLRLPDLVVEAMRSIDSIWTDAVTIQTEASRIRGDEVPMGSISPTLTVLKDQGVVERDGMKVALKERLSNAD
jgi:hypothetical protein